MFKITDIIIIGMLLILLIGGGVNLFSSPVPIRTEQDIRNEIELTRLRNEIQELRELERIETEIIKHYEESIQLDSAVFNSTKQQRDSLRAIAFGIR